MTHAREVCVDEWMVEYVGLILDLSLLVQVQIIRAYIILVVQQSGLVGAGADEKVVAQWVQDRLLEPRYQPPAFDPTAAAATPDAHRFCQDLETVQALGKLEGGMALHFLLTAVREVMSVFTEVQDRLGPARLEMLVHNWIEAVVDDAFGTLHHYQAIFDLSHC